MNKENKLEYWEKLSYEEFRLKQKEYAKLNTATNYTINYFEDSIKILKDLIENLLVFLINLVFLLMFPLGFVYHRINWTFYKGSRLNYFMFRRLIKRIKQKNK